MELEDLFFEQHPNAMLIFEPKTLHILRVNQSAVEKYGYSRKEFLQLTVEDIRIGEDRPTLIDNLESDRSHLFKGKVYQHQNKKGDILHVSITAQNITYEGQEVRVVHIQDLTKMVNLKNEYKKTLEQLHHHIDENPLAMIKVDDHFNIIEWSKRTEEKFGYPKEEVMGKTPFELGLIPSREQKFIKERIRKITTGEADKDQFNTIFVSKNKEQLDVRVHASALRDSEDHLTSVVAFIENITSQRRREFLLNKTQEMARVGGWEYDPDTENLFWTDEVYHIHGLSVGSDIDLDRALTFYTPEGKAKIEEGLNKALSEKKSYDLEVEIVTEKGKRKWVRAMGHPVIHNEDINKITGTFQDITERKQREIEINENAREKEVLLAEIHHRVKNNLAIISGLLELKALNIDDEELTQILRQSQLRIQSMGMIHEALYEADDFSNLDFSDFVKNLISTIENVHKDLGKDIAIEVSCSDSLELNVNQAIPCGLIINELITNSFKHAFIETSGGKVEVNIIHDEAKDEVILQVIDNGGGLPEEFMDGQTNSLGATLIDQLTTQLDGDLKMQNDDGAFIELRFDRDKKSGSSSQHFDFS